ncbi:MAG: hypothetical protein A2284_03595 [Deltaproteobacteria bacterium RIFOXYA12_FULL_61_11]|nr:MAG: hypothetical protein A2284_03595 [Deltaproteobacteria bacterium RIFOXYA12_FULL_61_11]
MNALRMLSICCQAILLIGLGSSLPSCLGVDRDLRGTTVFRLNPVPVAAVKPGSADEDSYQVYLPLVLNRYGNDARFAVNNGWGSDCCQYEETVLGLVPHVGGNQHELLSWNLVQSFQVAEWYDWFNAGHDPDIAPNSCTWSIEQYRAGGDGLVDRSGCAAWLGANPGKVWLIGNEPNGPYSIGGNGLTPEEYAGMYHQVEQFLRATDQGAKIGVAGWAGSLCETGLRDYVVAAVESHFQHFGPMTPDYWTLHIYTWSSDITACRGALECHRQLLADWRARGLVGGTAETWITETAWSGNDQRRIGETEMKAFMTNWFSYLRTQPDVTRWFWWVWHPDTTLVAGGAPTEVGACYAELSHGAETCP